MGNDKIKAQEEVSRKHPRKETKAPLQLNSEWPLSGMAGLIYDLIHFTKASFREFLFCLLETKYIKEVKEVEDKTTPPTAMAWP